MNLDHVFKKTNKRILGGSIRRPEVPEGLLSKCNMCGGAIVTEDPAAMDAIISPSPLRR